MIKPGHPGLSVGKQCRLLSISRSSFYYEAKGETALNLALMRRIDKQFLETPFYGVRQLTWHLRNEGRLVNEKRIRRLMRLMGVCQENRPLDAFADPPHSRSIRSPTPARERRGTKFTPTCCAGCMCNGQIRFGVPTSPICRCGGAFWISSPLWIGARERFLPGVSRTPLRPTFASRHLTRQSIVLGRQRS